MIKLILILLGICLLTPNYSWAGELQNITYQPPILTVRHQECQLKAPITDPPKLILPLKNCSGDKGQIIPSDSNPVKSIHWGQHDPKTIWLVITFKEQIAYQLHSGTTEHQLCFPNCPDTEKLPLQQEEFSADNSQLGLFKINGILFQVPLAEFTIEQFLEHSIGFVPEDIVRDGLPHFGAWRDDWLGEPRKHEGYDIYADNIDVLAAADGIVTAVKNTERAGLYIKLHHSYNVYTVYVHLNNSYVKPGDKVYSGKKIGRIQGPSGNAVAAQLHLEVKIGNNSIDPLPLIEEYYKNDAPILELIHHYKNQLPDLIELRNHKLQEFLKTPHNKPPSTSPY